jgi:hypothetical protein
MRAALESLRDKLATISGVETCKVGMESTMSPADYPMIRIVPSRILPAQQAISQRVCDTLIYFGMDSHEFDGGLEQLHWKLLAMEGLIITAAEAGSGSYTAIYRETIMDEDGVQPFKMMALRFDVFA